MRRNIITSENPEQSNNELHHAIIALDNAMALRLIISMDKKEINKKSLGNTPLMLALKTGNLIIASELLKRKDVDIFLCDNRFVMPLHLACAFRANDIIMQILEKLRNKIEEVYGAHDDEALKDFLIPGGSSELPSMHLNFVREKWPGAITMFDKKLEERTALTIYNEEYNEKKLSLALQIGQNNISIIDHDNLIISGLPELTDMILFHLRKICINQNLLSLSDFSESDKLLSSQYIYPSDIKIGLKKFIEYREKQKIDPMILYYLDPKITVKPTSEIPSTNKMKNT